MNNTDFKPYSAAGTHEIRKQSRQALAALARKAYKRRLTAGTKGVISMRLSPPGLFLITPLETSFEHISSGDPYLIDAAGRLLEGDNTFNLPPETKFHLKSYNVRTDINAIAHLYPPFASVYSLSLRGKPFHLVTDAASRKTKEVLRVQCFDCISRFCGLCSCRSDIRTGYAGVDVLLLEEDGIVTLGTSLEEALNLASLAEQTSREALSAVPGSTL